MSPPFEANRVLRGQVLALRGERAGLATDVDDNADAIQTNEESTHTMTLVRAGTR